MAETKDIQVLLDRAAIHDLHVRYFHGIDLGLRDQVRSCFAEDVVAQYDKRPEVRGIEALMAQIPSFARQESGEWKISTHFMGNLHFRSLAGDIAETETHAFAFLVLTTTMPQDQVAMRSLRYVDRLVRGDGAWRIHRRLHTLDWSCQVPTDFSTTLRERKATCPR